MSVRSREDLELETFWTSTERRAKGEGWVLDVSRTDNEMKWDYRYADRAKGEQGIDSAAANPVKRFVALGRCPEPSSKIELREGSRQSPNPRATDEGFVCNRLLRS